MINEILKIRLTCGLVLTVLLLAVACDFIGFYFGVSAIKSSFPTASHKTESSIILLLLFLSLGALAKGYKPLMRLSFKTISALTFFSLGGLVNHQFGSAPLNVSLYWAGANLVLVLLLGRIVFLGYASKIIDWRDLFHAMTASYFGLIYLAAMNSIRQ